MINKDNSISSKVRVSCREEKGKTFLKDSFYDIPYKVVHYGSRRNERHLEIMLMCYSPGVMDGDLLEMEIGCHKKSEMRLFTQSYNKIHPMKFGAKQRTKVHIEEGAILQYLPHPTIPFKDAVFDSETIITIEKGGHLIWSEITTAGRVHSEEIFEFSKLHTRTKVYYDTRLIVYDNLYFAPKEQPIGGMLFFEGFTHQATLMVVSEFASALKAELDELLQEQFEDMKYGFTLSNEKTLVLRVMGYSGEAIQEWFSNISNMCWSFITFHKSETPKSKSKTRKKTKTDA